MSMVHYVSKNLRLVYPSCLKLKKKEPQWYARGASSSAIVLVNPDPNVFAARARLVRNPGFKGGPGLGAAIIREGDYRSPKGLSGYERIVRLVNAVGQVSWGWLVVGNIGEKQTIVVQIGASDEDWQDGSVWENLLQSIEVA